MFCHKISLNYNDTKKEEILNSHLTWNDFVGTGSPFSFFQSKLDPSRRHLRSTLAPIEVKNSSVNPSPPELPSYKETMIKIMVEMKIGIPEAKG